MVTKSTIYGRRIQIAGSASSSTDASLLRYAHELVTGIVDRLLKEGAGLVLNAGKEPFGDVPACGLPSLIFDWTALETAAACLRVGSSPWPPDGGPAIIIVTSEKAVSEIPSGRLGLWEELIDGGFIEIEYIQPGARSATMIRDRQAQLGDVLLVISGGTGVEHLARLYLDRHKPLIPLDLKLGASRDDGTGGAWMLAREAKHDIVRFFSLRPPHAHMAGARLEGIATRNGGVEPILVAQKVIELLKDLDPPTVFYTRLFNPAVPAFQRVEDFFRNVVDPEIKDLGFRRVEVGTDPTTQPFINVAVFENLHYASVAVVDLTGERPNCYMELGYALGRGIKVIITAEQGAKLAFDADDIYCHFWSHGIDDVQGRQAFRDFWQTHINRSPIVE